MTTCEFWPDLERAWQSTSESAAEEPDLASGTSRRSHWRIIKTESRSRVLLLHADGAGPMVLKIYRTPPRLAWRTFGIASRANREFTVMMNAHRRGLPVVRPRYWLERRRRGRVEFSAIALDFADGPDLESWLIDGRANKLQRLSAAAATGELLGRFHRGGLFWGTVSTRNMILSGGDPGRLVAIDMPYARLYDRDITGETDAVMDLVLSLQLSDGTSAFEDGERKALVRAYCAGDEDRAQAMDAGLRLPTHREWKRRRLLRRLRNLLSQGATSRGRGGRYDANSGDYEVLGSESVYLAGD
jgi:tRNA A-37 threonylcarbamoyl transferase component Bud32